MTFIILTGQLQTWNNNKNYYFTIIIANIEMTQSFGNWVSQGNFSVPMISPRENWWKQSPHWFSLPIFSQRCLCSEISHYSFLLFLLYSSHPIVISPTQDLLERGHFVWLLLDRLAAAKSLQLCPTLCDPIDSSPSGSPIPGILQARTLEWVAISFSIAWKWKVKVKSLSCVQLLATPWTAAYQAPPSIRFSRQEY